MGFFRITGYIAIAVGFVAIIMSIPAFFILEFMYNEAGMMTNADILYGAFLWFLSYVILFISLIIPAHWKKHTKPIPEPEPDINAIP